jgi:hypothetical protein
MDTTTTESLIALEDVVKEKRERKEENVSNGLMDGRSNKQSGWRWVVVVD